MVWFLVWFLVLEHVGLPCIFPSNVYLAAPVPFELIWILV